MKLVVYVLTVAMYLVAVTAAFMAFLYRPDDGLPHTALHVLVNAVGLFVAASVIHRVWQLMRGEDAG